LLRRLKSDVDEELPPVTEVTLRCRMEAPQRGLYEKVRNTYRARVMHMVDEVGMERSTLGVLGAGHIAAEVIRRALAFKMTVLVSDPYVDPERIVAMGARPASLDELLPAADLVTLHVPLTPDTRNLVDAGFLERMKPGAYLINTSRGGVVEEEALLAALQSGRLAGAGLDVQVHEPATGLSRRLLELDTVVGMPHAGSKTLTTRERMADWAAESIIDVLEGRRPKHVVNREVLEHLSLRER
jgi:phosphoglycerate dehydrogenase-like enzyme